MNRRLRLWVKKIARPAHKMLRIASVNIEFNRHLDRVVPFLKKENADVVLLNELLEEDIPLFELELNMKCFFVPILIMPEPLQGKVRGSGVLTRLPAIHKTMRYGGAETVVSYDSTNEASRARTVRFMFSVSSVEKGGQTYKLGLTHFPWTEDGEADSVQRTCLASFLKLVEAEGDIVLLGDFNAPRGKEIFTTLASRFRDTIPAEYETSLDKNLHRVGAQFHKNGMDRYMVDGCFTTPGYRAHNVRLKFDVSDHAAVLADIKKAV